MIAEIILLLAVMGILLVGRILSDRREDQQRWFCFFEQKKMIAPVPRRIVSQPELPAHYQAIFPQQGLMPYMLYIPGSSSVLSPRKDILLILYDDRLTLYEGNPPAVHEVAFDDILVLEHGRMLFSRWLSLICPHQTYRLRYHASGDDDFARVINQIRFHSLQCTPPVFSHDQDPPRTRLSSVHETFMKMARSNLLPEQRVVEACFQPTYKLKKKTAIHCLSTTQVYTPHLSVMTENELILIQKREPIRTMTYDQYSTKILFIPYQQIRAVELLDDRKQAALQLTLSLKNQITLPLFWMRENEQAQSFSARLRETIRNIHHPA